MVYSEASPGDNSTHSSSEQDIEAVVSEIRIARRGHVGGYDYRNEWCNEQIRWRGRCLITWRDWIGICHRLIRDFASHKRAVRKLFDRGIGLLGSVGVRKEVGYAY